MSNECDADAIAFSVQVLHGLPVLIVHYLYSFMARSNCSQLILIGFLSLVG
jgi:hypothetical protein